MLSYVWCACRGSDGTVTSDSEQQANSSRTQPPIASPPDPPKAPSTETPPNRRADHESAGTDPAKILDAMKGEALLFA